MKNILHGFRWVTLAAVLSLNGVCATAQEAYDSLEISLLTCAPHDEIYSLYGHTAIRIEDPTQHLDMVVNYGLFDSSAPYFVLRFIFGLTDYSMGFTSFERFCQEYSYYGSEVTQQKLSLTAADKAEIMAAISVNALPENVVYRYNYFYDNCTTRARDMLVDHLGGKVCYHTAPTPSVSFRDLVHECTAGHPWARFGNDMLLGLQADRPIGLRQQQFLPRNLMRDFAHATIVDEKGVARPLVSNEAVVVEPRTSAGDQGGFPLSPQACALILLGITIAITLVERFTRRIFWGYDMLLLLSAGLAGILLFLMVFSEHPTVRVNLQLLLLNPLPLVFLCSVVKSLRKSLSHIWWRIWEVLIILFLIGGFFQQYAEGMYVLALTLLTRSVVNDFLRSTVSYGKANNTQVQKNK